MNGANFHTNFHGVTWGNAVLVGAAWVGLVVIVAALFDVKAAAAGWLTSFVFAAQILLGSLSLGMIHRLTGGGWGAIVAPGAVPAAAAVPLLVALAIPLFVAVPALYPWPHQAGAIKADVLSYYLNIPSYIVRSAVALIGWSALAWFLPRTPGRAGERLAALGLVFHALVISSVSIDWYLSLEAPFTSSSFGASVAVSSLVAALAWSAVVAPSAGDDAAVGDVGSLLLATILGITYIDFMAVLVIWYGDIPREEIWLVVRDRWPWSALAVAAFLLGSVFPTLALLLARVRNARRPLRGIGLCVLAGLAAYDAYLIVPPIGSAALWTALVAVIGVGLMMVGVFLRAAAEPRLAMEPPDAR
jgi:hypothetical protein